MKNILGRVRTYFRKTGYDIVMYTRLPINRRMKLLENHGINLILDVGANSGQYGIEMRNAGYAGKIISFEPLSEAYRILSENARNDPDWRIMNIALGEKKAGADIRVSANSVSSSFLDLAPGYPGKGAEAVSRERVSMETLDSLFPSLVSPEDRVFLKIDAQGYEKWVLEGARNSLAEISGIQVETALVENYEGEMLLPELINTITEYGFTIMSIESGYCDPDTGRQYEADCIFFKQQHHPCARS